MIYIAMILHFVTFQSGRHQLYLDYQVIPTEEECLQYSDAMSHTDIPGDKIVVDCLQTKDTEPVIYVAVLIHFLANHQVEIAYAQFASEQECNDWGHRKVAEGTADAGECVPVQILVGSQDSQL